MLEERHMVAQRLLTEARAQLEQLTHALLEHETLDQQALLALLGPRPVRSASATGEREHSVATR